MKIIATMGDANGIGIEVLIKAIVEFDKRIVAKSDIDIHISGNMQTIQEYLSHFELPVIATESTLQIHNRICPVIECGSYSPVEFGKETALSGKLAGESISFAVDAVLNNKYDAIVTMPVSKSALYKAGWKFRGHTEMLAESCKLKDPLMILCADNIRVALTTIHIPVSLVSSSININQIMKTGLLFDATLSRDFSIKNPKIAVLGLNPHAGEDGNMGDEETKIIIPAIDKLIKSGIEAEGPFSADGFFAHGGYLNYDGILAMYHDQGLIPLKMLAKGSGVNFTAGLPIVRTSPDHGTAFDIAGRGIANSESSLMALKLADSIFHSREQAVVK